MNKFYITIALLVLSVTGLNAQAFNTTARFFEESYNNEQNGDYAIAIRDMLSVYKEDFYEANLRLGWLHYLNNDQEKSQEYYEKAVALRPESIEARLGLIYPISQMGEWGKVTEIYKELVVMAPSNTLIRYNLAYVQYTHFKKYKEALANVKVVVDYYPFDYNSNMLIGKVYRSLGKLKEARAHFLTANYIDPITGDAMKELKKL